MDHINELADNVEFRRYIDNMFISAKLTKEHQVSSETKALSNSHCVDNSIMKYLENKAGGKLKLNKTDRNAIAHCALTIGFQTNYFTKKDEDKLTGKYSCLNKILTNVQDDWLSRFDYVSSNNLLSEHTNIIVLNEKYPSVKDIEEWILRKRKDNKSPSMKEFNSIFRIITKKAHIGLGENEAEEGGEGEEKKEDGTPTKIKAKALSCGILSKVMDDIGFSSEKKAKYLRSKTLDTDAFLNELRESYCELNDKFEEMTIRTSADDERSE